MRKPTTCILVLFTLLTTVQARAQDCPLKIEDYSWRGSFYLSRYVHDDQGEFKIEVKNNSTKTIRLVEWHLFLYDSIRGNAVTDHLKFITDDKPIKPGQSRKFTKRFEYPDQPDYVKGNYRIERVVFEDGSEWKREKKD